MRRIDEHVCRTVDFGQLSGTGCTGQGQDARQEPAFLLIRHAYQDDCKPAVQLFPQPAKIEQSFLLIPNAGYTQNNCFPVQSVLFSEITRCWLEQAFIDLIVYYFNRVLF